MTNNHEALAQLRAEQWLEQCYDAADPAIEDAEVPEGAELFCGCTTCIVREVLTAATPHLYAALIDVLTEEGVDVPPRIVKMFTNP